MTAIRGSSRCARLGAHRRVTHASRLSQLTRTEPGDMGSQGLSGSPFDDEQICMLIVAYMSRTTHIRAIWTLRRLRSSWRHHLPRWIEKLDLSSSIAAQIGWATGFDADSVLRSLSPYISPTSVLLRNNQGVSDNGLVRGVASFSDPELLRVLDLHECRAVTDVGIAAVLQVCTRLANLNLSVVYRISDEGLRHLCRSNATLRTVELARCRHIGDPTLRVLSSCSALQELSLAGCRVTDEGLHALSRCRSLNSLNLTDCDDVSDQGLVALAAGCQRLQTIVLSRCAVSDLGVVALGENCTQLRNVVLFECTRVGDAGVAALAACSDLSRLNLFGCNKVTDGSIVSVARHCTRIELLVLSGCPVTDESMLALLKHPCLAELWLYGCTAVSGSILRRLSDRGIVRGIRNEQEPI